MEHLLGKHWHHLPKEEVLEVLDSDADKGLDTLEVSRRLAELGPNSIPVVQGAGPLKRFIGQFHQPLVYILISASLITFVLQEYIDSAVIFAVVLVNAIVGFIQENKALTALAALSKGLHTKATVRRSGKRTEINSEDLVVGDIVLLQSGDKVPADLRLVAVKDLQIDESTLTGESVAVAKTNAVLEKELLLSDRRNMTYSSCLVTYGQGTGVVIATGINTEVGRISELISSADDLATPLTRKINKFTNWLLYAIIALGALVFLIGVRRGESTIDMFMAAVALAVGAIPEGLPAAITITLAIGVNRMAKRRAIIRKLPAVETLGSTTIICSDKTGTLTQNQMTVKEIYAGGELFQVSGSGYNPDGTISPANGNAALRECLLAGLLCNDSQLVPENERWLVQGDPTEGALLTAAAKVGLEIDAVKHDYPRVDVVPFESQHQYMATLHDDTKESRRVIYLKGAFEKVLPLCESSLGADGQPQSLDHSAVEQICAKIATEGLRVLAMAKLVCAADKDSLDITDLRGGFSFLGLQAMIDPPRAEAITAVATCHRAGIGVKMITGDHALTAGKIAEQLGLQGQKAAEHDGLAVLTGQELLAMSDAELLEAIDHISVYARVTPEQKIRLVRALQAKGHIVAMTGDGVNDAPALRQADIGIAMGIAGTEVSKEAADMVLTDDNFATIEAAVEEGRGVYDNLTKFIVWTLPTNLGEGLVILTAVVLATTLPLSPLHILWINMSTAMLLGLMLAFEPKEAGIMQRPPVNPKQPLLSTALLRRMCIVAGVMLLSAFGLFKWALLNEATVSEARTIAVNAFVFIEIFYLLNCRSLSRPIQELGFFSNKYVIYGISLMIVLQLLFTYAPFMNLIFDSAPIGVTQWLWILAAGLLTYLLVELDKAWRRRRH